MQPGFSRIVRVMKSLNFRSESSSLNMSLPIISFRATQLNVLALLKNLRNYILISVPFRTRMLELFSELLLVFTWSKEPSSLQKSTASMVLPQQQYQPYGCKIVARYSSSRLPTIPSIVIMMECPFQECLRNCRRYLLFGFGELILRRDPVLFGIFAMPFRRPAIVS